MTRDEIISLVQDRMTRTDNTAQAQAEIKMAQIELERNAFLPWFLITIDDSLATVADTETVALPTGFIREPDEEETCVWIEDQSTTPYQYTKLIKTHTYAEILAKYRYDENQEPKAYYVEAASNYRFRPIPEAVYPLRVMCYVKDTVLSSNITNSWCTHAPDLVAARLGMLLTRYDVDKTMYEMFKDDYNTAMARLQVQDEAYRMAGLDAVMGDGDA